MGKEPSKKSKIELECTHDFSIDDESQTWTDDSHFTFKMRCDLCGKLYRVPAYVDFCKIELIPEKNDELAFK